MKLLLILLLFVSQYSYANGQKCEDGRLTYKLYYQTLDNVTANQDVNVIDEGDYILISARASKFYAFTTKTNPAHPGYIEWKIRFDEARPYFENSSSHGKNCEAFKDFETKMNSIMDDRLNSILP